MFASCADGELRVLDAGTGRMVTTAAHGNPSTAITRLSVVVGTWTAPFLPGEQLVCLGPGV